MNHDLRLIASSLHAFAKAQGWAAGDYKIFLKSNPDWGVHHVILTARNFDHVKGTPWSAVMHYLERYPFIDSDLLKSVGLTISTFSQAESGGLHSIGPDYEEVDAPFATEPAA